MEAPAPVTAPVTAPRDLDWPWWLPFGSALGAFLVAFEALRHRVLEHGADTLTLDLPLAALALLGFATDFVSHRHRRFFLPRLLWAALCIAGVTALLVRTPVQEDFIPFVLVLMCIQGASTSSLREGLVMLAAACGALVVVDLATDTDGAAIWVVGNIAGFAGGFAVRMSIEAVMTERARQADLAGRAATEERQRIAREVHDVIAHSLSVTLLHLTGARRQLETGGDPAEAAEALRDAERLGREAMNDIRRTVGLLAPEGTGERAPMPSAADIEALVGEFAGAGLAVTCRVAGDPGTVSLASGLGLYRITQEALANVAKHAPGAAAEVTLDAVADPVRLVVSNGSANGAHPIDDAPDVGGLGLQGMEERTRLLGGEFRAGPGEAGGWVVDVRVPREVTAG